MISSHLKRSSLLWVDNNSRLLQQKTVKKRNSLAFHWCLFETEHYMAAWRYEISLVVLKNISLVSRSHLVSSMYNFNTLVVSVRCNPLVNWRSFGRNKPIRTTKGIYTSDKTKQSVQTRIYTLSSVKNVVTSCESLQLILRVTPYNNKTHHVI